VLEAAVLLVELQRFADPSAPVFSGWPLGRIDARRRWAHAFDVYVRDMVDRLPVLSPTAVTLDFSAVEAAFFADLGLDSATVEAAAIDFAGAWRAAILALLPGATAAHPTTSTPFEFAAMDPADVATRHEALRAELVRVFRRGRALRRDDLDEIAQAFHAATDGLRSTATPFVVIYG